MRTILTAVILAVATGIWAQQPADTVAATPQKENRFTIDVNLLNRGEIRRGGLSSEGNSEDKAAFIIARTLLGMEYERGILSTRVTAQHSGTWGSEETNSFNIYEAWLQLRSPKGFFTKIGRQDLSYDDQRIFGADHWAMTAESHDALVVGYENKRHKIHLMGAYNQNVKNMKGGTYFSGGLQPYKAMEALWYHYDVPNVPLGISLIGMNIGMQSSEDIPDTCTYQQQLVGTYINFHPKRFSAELAFYYQMGKQEDGVPIRAFMGSTKAVYSPGIYSLYAGYDYLSGDMFFALPPHGAIGMALHDTIRGFNAIYGSHHDFYGAMDFFYLDSFVGNFTPGLQTLYVGGTINPIKKLNFDLSYHYYAITTNLDRIPSKTLGHDLEIKASYAFSDDVRLSAGYSYLIGTDTMATLQQLDERRRMSWGWLMLSITPKLYTTKWQDKK